VISSRVLKNDSNSHFKVKEHGVVTPTKVGVQCFVLNINYLKKPWIPASAGMTKSMVILSHFPHLQTLFQHPARVGCSV